MTLSYQHNHDKNGGNKLAYVINMCKQFVAAYSSNLTQSEEVVPCRVDSV